MSPDDVGKALFVLALLALCALLPQSHAGTGMAQISGEALAQAVSSSSQYLYYIMQGYFCTTCEDTSSYNTSNLFIITDETNYKVQIALSWGNKRLPVKYAPIIVRVRTPPGKTTGASTAPPAQWPAYPGVRASLAPQAAVEHSALDRLDQQQYYQYDPELLAQLQLTSTEEDVGDLYVTYTDASGQADFDFTQWKDSCKDYQFFYCYSSDGCGLAKCFAAMGLDSSTTEYSSTDEMPLAPGATDYSSQTQDPALITSNYETYEYCPPEPNFGETTPPFCFPLILIFSFLAGSLYLSGRNPLSMFDFSTPHMGKHFRYVARGRGFGFDLGAIAKGVAKGAKLATKAGRADIKAGEQKAMQEEKAQLLGKVALVTGGKLGGRMGRAYNKGKAAEMASKFAGLKAMFDRNKGGGLLKGTGAMLKASWANLPGVMAARQAFSFKEMAKAKGFWANLGALAKGIGRGLFAISSLNEIFREWQRAGQTLRCYASTQAAVQGVENKSGTVTRGGVTYKFACEVEKDKNGNPKLDQFGQPIVRITFTWGTNNSAVMVNGKIVSGTINGKPVTNAEQLKNLVPPGVRIEVGAQVLPEIQKLFRTYQIVGAAESYQRKVEMMEKLDKYLDAIEKKGGAGVASDTINKLDAAIKATGREHEFESALKIIAEAKKTGDYEFACARLSGMTDQGKAALASALGPAAAGIMDSAQAVTVYGMTNDTPLASKMAVVGLADRAREYEASLPEQVRDALLTARAEGTSEAYARFAAEIAAGGDSLVKALGPKIGDSEAKSFVQDAANLSAAVGLTTRVNDAINKLPPEQVTAMGLTELRDAAMKGDYGKVAVWCADESNRDTINALAKVATSDAGKIYDTAQRAVTGQAYMEAYREPANMEALKTAGFDALAKAVIANKPEDVVKFLGNKDNASEFIKKYGEETYNTLNSSAQDLASFRSMAGAAASDINGADLKLPGMAQAKAALEGIASGRQASTLDIVNFRYSMEKPEAFASFNEALPQAFQSARDSTALRLTGSGDAATPFAGFSNIRTAMDLQDATRLGEAFVNRDNLMAVTALAKHSTEFQSAQQDALQARAIDHMAITSEQMQDVLRRMKENNDNADRLASGYVQALNRTDETRTANITNLLEKKDADGVRDYLGNAANEAEIQRVSKSLGMSRDQFVDSLVTTATGWKAMDISGNMGTLHGQTIGVGYLSMAEQAFAAGITEVKKPDDVSRFARNFYAGVENIEMQNARLGAMFRASEAKPWENASDLVPRTEATEKLPDSFVRDYYRSVSKLFENSREFTTPEFMKEHGFRRQEEVSRADAAISRVTESLQKETDSNRAAEQMAYARAFAEYASDPAKMTEFSKSYDRYQKAEKPEQKALESERMLRLDAAYAMKDKMQEAALASHPWTDEMRKDNLKDVPEAQMAVERIEEEYKKNPTLQAGTSLEKRKRDAQDDLLIRNMPDAEMDRNLLQSNPGIPVGGNKTMDYNKALGNFESVKKDILEAKTPAQLDEATKRLEAVYGPDLAKAFKPRSTAASDKPEDNNYGKGQAGASYMPSLMERMGGRMPGMK